MATLKPIARDRMLFTTLKRHRQNAQAPAAAGLLGHCVVKSPVAEALGGDFLKTGQKRTHALCSYVGRTCNMFVSDFHPRRTGLTTGAER